jgi:hypothetical protein
MNELTGYEDLRDAYRGALRVPSEGRECPPGEDVWRSAREELDLREDEEILLHIGTCSACAASWSMARDLAQETPGLKEQGGGNRFEHIRWVPLAAAAAVVISLAALALLYWPPTDTAPVYRAPDTEWLRATIPESVPLPRQRCLLRWTPGPEGTVYQVRVTSQKLDVLAQAGGLEAPEFLVPEEALETLAPGSRIVWQVTARLPDGKRVDSTSFLVRVE